MSDKSQQASQRAMLEQALGAIEKLQAKVRRLESSQTEAIAVVGMSCRYPGAPSLNAYWDLLDQGTDAIGPIPAERWAGRGEELGLENIQGGFLENIDLFDAGHFGISGREAETMDPQQRLMLEVSWEALEHAGIAPDSLKNSSTGVFVGITTNDYARMAMADPQAGLDVYSATGGALNVAAGRIAYSLGLSGPAIAIDTACSSSLVAMHLACQSLRNKECSLALAGGVNVLLAPEPFVCFADWGMMAPDGRCKTFDEKADGFVRSEGCGVLALKRLSDARNDGDHVLAVIRGTAVNQDGASSGLTVPNGLAQEDVLRQSLVSAGLRADDVDYVEAHGTGTTLGDPIELEAIAKIYARKRDASNPLRVGSVKTNIGHAESASGVAGVIKSILALQHDRIPAHLHFEKLSSRISLRGAPVEIPAVASPWPRGDRVRRAAISSFGFSGTNANVIIEQGDVFDAFVSDDDALQLLPLSARTEAGLRDALESLRPRLANARSGELANICFEAARGRARFNHRAALVAKDGAEAVSAIDNFLAGNPDQALLSGQSDGQPKLAFLFTGQGSQSFEMGAELYREAAVFRGAIDECAAAVSGILPTPLLELLGYAGSAPADSIDRTENTQPALFAFEYAMFRLWESFGVKPSALIGHSLGEYVAATVAGVLTLADALKLVVTRAALMQSLPEVGMMAAVRCSEVQALDAVAHNPRSLSVAAVNGAESCVLAGERDALVQVLEKLDKNGIESRELQVSHAFHSPLMQPMVDAFLQVARKIDYSAPETDLVLNETGLLCGENDIDADYWARHIINPVRFAASVDLLVENGYRHFLELGPAPALSAMLAPDHESAETLLLASQRTGNDGLVQVLRAAAGLFVCGVELDWAALNQHGVRPEQALPHYPFQRKRYWLKAPEKSSAYSAIGPVLHPLLGVHLASPSKTQIFDNRISLERFGFLADHRIGGKILYPAAAYMEMAFAAARHLFGSDAVAVSDGVLREAFVLQADTDYRLQLLATEQADKTFSFEIYSSAAVESSGEWTLHATGCLTPDAEKDTSTTTPVPQELVAVDVAALKAQMVDVGLQYGPQFDGLQSADTTENFAAGNLRLPIFDDDAKGLRVHPGILDASFHLIGAAINHAAADSVDRFYLPFSYERVRLHRALGEQASAQVHLRHANEKEVCADISIFGLDQELAVEVTGLRAKGMSRSEFQALLGENNSALHEIVWEDAPKRAIRQASETYLLIGGSESERQAIADRVAEQGGTLELDSTDNWAGLSGVIDLAGTQASPDEIQAASFAGIERLRQFASSAAGENCRYLFVTRHAQSELASQATNPAQAALWGLAVTAGAELGDRDIRVVDCDTDDFASALLSVLHRDDLESRIRLSHDGLRVPRLKSAAPSGLPASPYRLTLGEQRSVQAIGFEQAERGEPGAGQVELEVLATGVNFRDVLTALGMYPGPASDLGNECCGRVIRVGEGVSTLQAGDFVTAIADSTFSSNVIAEQNLCFRVPASLSLAQAAVFPIAQLTAYLSLHEIGQIKAGDWVLIHAAAGGVGLAAVYLALAAGAKIVATAGSDTKREFLSSLGVDHVFDSRSTLSAERVFAATDNHGVDIVLNSLTDEAIDEGLKSLAHGGRFVEIGLRDLRDEKAIEALGKSVSYHPVLLGDNCREQPRQVQAMFAALCELLEQGAIPAPKLHSFAAHAVSDAFDFMARAQHIGRIAVIHPSFGENFARRDASYVISGGLGALGLHAARWLADSGAGQLVLLGRTQPTAEVAAQLDDIRASGVRVEFAQGDVAASDWQLAADSDRLPVRGVIHAAGVIDDAALSGITEEQHARVLDPKVNGLQNLIATFDPQTLDFLVAYSSASAVMGSPGQSSYASANAFMDAKMQSLRQAGHNAISINWGAWEAQGMAAQLSDRMRADWAARGIGTIDSAAGVSYLQHALAAGDSQQVVLPMDWSTFFTNANDAATNPFLSELSHSGVREADASQAQASDFVASLASLSDKRRLAKITQRLKLEVAAVLGIAVDEIQGRAGLTEQGMDSLMAVELAGRLGAVFEQKLPSTFAFDYPSVSALARYLSDTVQEQAEPQTSALSPDDSMADDVDDLSEAELAEALRSELDLSDLEDL